VIAPEVVGLIEDEDRTAPDLEERLRDLLHVCEGLRALCSCGEQRGLTLADAVPLAMLAAQLAAELQRDLLRSAGAS
jgi:hypothetical protein